MSREIFSANMIYLRHKRGLTQREMASKIGVTVNRYGAWEDGRCYPKVTMLLKLCDYLQTQDIYGLITKPIKQLKPY